MKNSSLTLISLFALSSSVFGQTASNLVTASSSGRGSHQFTQSGAPTDLMLCSYELCHLDENGAMKIEPAASGSMAAIISQASESGADKYLVFYPVGQEGNPNARRVLRNQYIITLTDGADLNAVRERCGMKSIKLIREGSNLALCEEDSAGRVLGQLTDVLNDPEVSAAEPIFAKNRFKRLVPTDPFYAPNTEPETDGNYQWYLNNEGINGSIVDLDINVEDALTFSTGAGVTVAIIDDGISTDHLDLVLNATGPHLNLLDGDPDDPTTFDDTATHGTGIAALIGASFNNDEGISGVAPQATLSGIRLLSGDAESAGLIADSDEAAALSFSTDIIDVYSSSWGPDDTTLNLEGPGTLATMALADGVANGRGGDGVIYVWAAGNGGEIGDRSDYDGYANSRFTIAVGSVDDSGQSASYSEEGSNIVVTAPSSGGSQNILTATFALDTDDDDNAIRTSDYDTTFGGSSASAALVSGVVALMLDQNPDLNWREVQDILIRTAFMVDPSDGDWFTNAAGINFNHQYGAGLVDANAAVIMASDLITDPDLALGDLESFSLNRFFTTATDDPSSEPGNIPDNNGESLLVGFDMSQDENGNPLPNLRVEHVEFVATIITPSRSDLEIVLISPSGTQSVFQTVDADNTEQSIFRWPFMSVRNWGEGSAGTWVVRITDSVSGDTAFLNNASLVVHGSADPDAPLSQVPILTSAPLITISQGAELNYLLQTAGATSVTLGDLPDGFVFDPETSVISGSASTSGLFEVPVILTDAVGVQGNFVLNFVITPTAVALGDALGFFGFPAVSGGDQPWAFEFSDFIDREVPDGSSARSAVGLADGESSIFGFDGLEAGVLMFDWRTSSQEGADRLWFNRGGEVPQIWDAFISGEREWGRTAIYLPENSNDVRWIYNKDASIGEGDDRGLVDNVEFVTMPKFRESVEAAVNLEGIDLEFDSRTLFMPFAFPAASRDAEGNATLLRSSTIGNGQTASLAGWLEGPGTLSFTGFNFAEPNDVFELLIDGVVTNTFEGIGAGGQIDRIAVNEPIVDGRHRFQIRFRKDFSGSDARELLSEIVDGVFVDDLRFIQDGTFAAFTGSFDVDPFADDDGDGYSNLLEYAFGGNYLQRDVPSYLPKIVSSGDSEFVEFGIDTSRSDLNLSIEQSVDLLDWDEAERAALVRTEGDVEVFQIPVLREDGSPALFFRVHAEVK